MYTLHRYIHMTTKNNIYIYIRVCTYIYTNTHGLSGRCLGLTLPGKPPPPLASQETEKVAFCIFRCSAQGGRGFPGTVRS